MNRRAGAIVVVAVLLGAAFGHARAAQAAPPPTIQVEVIGKGKVTGTGISCGLGALACYSAYGSIAGVSLTATPSPGWTFSGWEDDASGCGATAAGCSVTPATATATATAVFTTSSATQTATYGVSVGSGGDVTNGSGNYTIDCGTNSTCSVTTLVFSTITVTETPDSTHFFGGWGGSCSGTSIACATYLSANRTASATFVLNSTNQLSVTVSGNGSVTGGGISCGAGSTCDAQEPPNAKVTLTATPADGYAFTGWDSTSDCNGTQPTCTLQMDSARTAIADFAKLVPFSLTVSGAGTVSGGGITCGPGPQTCTGSTTPNQQLTFTASPPTGGTVTWSGCSSTAGSICTVNVTTNAVSVSATFGGGGTPPPGSTYALTISVTGNGTVVSSSNSSVHCTAAGGSGCTVNVQANSTLSLSAVPASGTAADFTSWGTSACSSFTSTSCTLTMTGPKSVTAAFAGASTTYALSAQVTGSGTVSGAGVNCTSAGGTGCAAQQAAGATVTLTASPVAGATFTGWGGACTGTSTTCQVSMTTAKSVTATFATSSGGGGGGTTVSLALSVTGAGEVTSPDGACVSTEGKTKGCTQDYQRGQTVVLRAKPAAGFALAGWSGACTGKKATCDVSMSSTLAVNATFAALALASAAKPKVTGHRIRFTYVAHEAGTVTMTTRGPGRVAARTATIRTGTRTMTLTVPKPGRYTFTLTLKSSTGTHGIRWRVTVR